MSINETEEFVDKLRATFNQFSVTINTMCRLL